MGTTTVSRRTIGGVLVEDFLLALLLTAWIAADALTSGDWPRPYVASAALAAPAAAALVVRRTRPLISLTVTVGGLSAVHVFLGPYQTGSSLVVVIVAAYSVGAHAYRSWPPALLCVALIAAWTMDAEGAAEAISNAGFVLVVTGLPYAIGRAARHQEERSHQLGAEAAALEAQQQALVRRTEEERRRIARELHDVVSHSLGVVVLHAGVAEEWMARDPARARQALAQIRETGNEAIGEMARLVQLMRDEQTDNRAPQPTLQDLGRLVEQWRSSGLEVTLSCEGTPRPVPAAVQLSAFRVAQESLTNVAKHSDATRANVMLYYDQDRIEVEVRDNGRHARAAAGLRSGLAGLRERVAVFGGRFEAGEEPTGGWTVRASFPVLT
jgi:signal transduction histidine kinase